MGFTSQGGDYRESSPKNFLQGGLSRLSMLDAPGTDVDTLPLPALLRHPSSPTKPKGDAIPRWKTLPPLHPPTPPLLQRPDPSKTTHCTAPLHPSSRLVQYALMIDAAPTARESTSTNSTTAVPHRVRVRSVQLITRRIVFIAGPPEEAAKSLMCGG